MNVIYELNKALSQAIEQADFEESRADAAEAAMAAERAKYAALVDAARRLWWHNGSMEYDALRDALYNLIEIGTPDAIDAAPAAEPEHSQICTWNIEA